MSPVRLNQRLEPARSVLENAIGDLRAEGYYSAADRLHSAKDYLDDAIDEVRDQNNHG